MARTGPSQTDMALIEAVARLGVRVSAFQLERWRTAGLLPRNERQRLGRGRGSSSALAPDSVARAALLGADALQGRRSGWAEVVRRDSLVSEGRNDEIRAAMVADLERARLQGLPGVSDEAWESRYEASRSGSRNLGMVDGHAVLSAMLSGGQLPAPFEAKSLQPMLHAMLGGLEDVTLAATMDALAEMMGFDDAWRANVQSSIRAMELVGEDPTFGLSIGIDAGVQLLTGTEGAMIARAWLAAHQALQRQWATLIGLAMDLEAAARSEVLRSERPEFDQVERLAADPTWQMWGRWFPISVGEPTVQMAITMAAHTLLVVPGQIDDVEHYADRLSAIVLNAVTDAPECEGT